MPYAIVGALAASFYGLVRASLDADAVISVGKDDGKLGQLVSSLKNDSLKIQLRKGDSSDPIRSVINIEDRFGNRVDLLIGIRGMTEDVFDRVVSASFMSQSVKMISIEDFITMKIHAGIAKDIQDVNGVLQISSQKINLPLLKKLTHQYGKEGLERLKKMLKERR